MISRNEDILDFVWMVEKCMRLRKLVRKRCMNLLKHRWSFKPPESVNKLVYTLGTHNDVPLHICALRAVDTGRHVVEASSESAGEYENVFCDGCQS